MKNALFTFVGVLCFGVTFGQDQSRMTLSLEEAERLVHLPLECIDTEYPNKLNQVIGGDEDLRSPEALHPAFYGCFDWHSAVHGHWSLVRLVKTYPDLKEADEIIRGLHHHINPETIKGELLYFDDPLSQGFERMYGWAWLLKLAEELHAWETPDGDKLYTAMEPLTNVLVERIKVFLPKLQYPIRVGTHTNTAFAMSMIYDFAKETNNMELLEVVSERAVDFYATDRGCPINWEPSGYDFLSPCFEEIDLMRRVIDEKAFKQWLGDFMPEIMGESFQLEPGIVADRTDGHLVHLDGLNYSRAWCMYGIVETLPELDHLIAVANQHINHSLPDLTDGNYEGGHWLASFALLALSE